MSHRLFISSSRHAAEPERIFMLQVSYWLRAQGLRTFFWEVDAEEGDTEWSTVIQRELVEADLFLSFLIGPLQSTHSLEAQAVAPYANIPNGKMTCMVGLRDEEVKNAPHLFGQPLRWPRERWDSKEAAARECAIEIAARLGVRWVCDDGLPIYESQGKAGSDEGFPFKHEKDIINAYLKDQVSVKSREERRRIHSGCPLTWPAIVQTPPPKDGEGKAKEDPIRERWNMLPGERYETKVVEGEVGGFRPEGNEQRYVLAQCLSSFEAGAMHERHMEFVEAGARRMQRRHPRVALAGEVPTLKCGILVSGGIAPAINAVIAGIVERHCLYANKDGYGLRVEGLRNGFIGFGLPTLPCPLPVELVEKVPLEHGIYRPVAAVREHANDGGSILGTSRLPDLVRWSPEELRLLGRPLDELGGKLKTPEERGSNLEHIVTQAQHLGIQILYVIGGDGSMKAAHALWMTAQAMKRPLAVVGIPKTMDNDILWVWASFGFQSAVQQSTEIIRQLWTEASSNPRLCVVQLFGSESGFVVTDAAAASGKCDLFLTPETPFSMEFICTFLADKLIAEAREYAVVVMAESAVPTDVEQYAKDPTNAGDTDQELLTRIALTPGERDALTQYHKDRRIIGQTPDDLRSGALKVVSRVLQYRLQHGYQGRWRNLRVFTNEPRHLIRAIAPSSSDIISARRFGFLAVDGAMAGFEDFMISWWLTEYVMVPLPLVVLGRKRIPTKGAFHAAARASTGQPLRLELPVHSHLGNRKAVSS